MATIKFVSSGASLGRAIDYVTKEEKVLDKYVSGINVQPSSVKQQMAITKRLFGKEGGRQYKHFIQSFHKDEKITPKLAHELARDFISRSPMFNGFEVLIATHQDKEHLHTHFIVNSVNFEDGHKFQMNSKEMYDLHALNDTLCRERGLSVASKGYTFEGAVREETTSFNRKSYEVLKKAEKGEIKSYVWDIANKVLDAQEISANKQDFIKNLEKVGVSVNWTETRKYITFENEKGEKIRNNKLEQYFNIPLEKGDLENEFEINKAREERTSSIIDNSKARTESAGIDRAERDAERIRLDFIREYEIARRNKEIAERERAAREREERERKIAEKRRAKSREDDFEI